MFGQSGQQPAWEPGGITSGDDYITGLGKHIQESRFFEGSLQPIRLGWVLQELGLVVEGKPRSIPIDIRYMTMENHHFSRENPL